MRLSTAHQSCRDAEEDKRSFRGMVSLRRLGVPGPPEVRTGPGDLFVACRRLLDALPRAQVPQDGARISYGTLQDVLDCTHALGMQALLRLQCPQVHERSTLVVPAPARSPQKVYRPRSPQERSRMSCSAVNQTKSTGSWLAQV